MKKIIMSIVLLLSLLSLTGCSGGNSFRSECADAGGHIYQTHGKAALICISDDGRILEL